MPDTILVRRRVIYRWRLWPSDRWKYYDTHYYVLPDVSEHMDEWLKKQLSDDAEVLFIGPPTEEFSGGVRGITFNTTRSEVRHLIG